MHRPRRRWRARWIGAVVALAVGAWGLGQLARGQQAEPPDLSNIAPGPVVVVMTTGERLRGDFIEVRGGSVRIRIAGIETAVPLDQVDRVVPQGELMERYRALRGAIPDSDAERLVFLAEWLRTNGMLDEALREVRTALDADPTNGEGIRLRQLIEQQIALRDRQQERRERAERPAEDEGGAESPRRPLPGEFPLLTPEEVNLLKIYEVNLEDPPRILISRETLEKLVDRYAGQLDVPATREGRAAFMRRPAAEILDTMYRLRARDLYAEVEVQGLPRSLEKFRDHVHAAWLMNGCATARCHGGEEAGRLMLFSRRPTAEQSLATNFIILDRFRTASGLPLINYDVPEKSPLLQMALPPDKSSYPHPRVEGWKAIFTGPEARQFQASVDWIKSMYLPRPELPIAYDPPTGRSAGGAPPEDEPPPETLPPQQDGPVIR